MAAQVLIIGGSSYVGRHLFAKLGPKISVATFNSQPLSGGRYFNSLEMRVRDVVRDSDAFTHAVVLLGDTEPNSCICDPERSNAINVKSMERIFDDLKELGIKPLFTSSEFVFDGVKGNYSETDAVQPILLYGEQKLKCEYYLKKLNISHVIFRLAKVYGEELGDGSLFTNWAANLKNGGAIRCAADQAFSPVHVDDVIAAIISVIEQDLSGLFHVSGNRRYTRLKLLETFLEVLRDCVGDFEINVESCSIHDFDLPERRPADVSMRADKLLQATGIQVTQVQDTCLRIISAMM